jgi:hypothetical protein
LLAFAARTVDGGAGEGNRAMPQTERPQVMQSRRRPHGEVWFVLAALAATLALTPATLDAQSSGPAAVIAAVRAKTSAVSKETDIPARFATALGFTPKGATWGYMQGGVTDAGGVIHTIGDDPASGDVLIVRRQPELLLAFNAGERHQLFPERQYSHKAHGARREAGLRR